MSCFYCVDGIMKVIPSETSQALLEDLQAELGEIEWESELKNGIIEFSIHGGMLCSFTTATNIDDVLEEFGEHVTEPARFATECDNESGEVWVGKEPEISQGIRQALIEKARQAIAKLTTDEMSDLFVEFYSHVDNPETDDGG